MCENNDGFERFGCAPRRSAARCVSPLPTGEDFDPKIGEKIDNGQFVFTRLASFCLAVGNVGPLGVPRLTIIRTFDRHRQF